MTFEGHCFDSVYGLDPLSVVQPRRTKGNQMGGELYQMAGRRKGHHQVIVSEEPGRPPTTIGRNWIELNGKVRK